MSSTQVQHVVYSYYKYTCSLHVAIYGRHVNDRSMDTILYYTCIYCEVQYIIIYCKNARILHRIVLLD